ncbi:MAG TPA: 2Fe-2S iron-sulfur cluster-binding protein [Steroidobacteraceae bacterium]|jgi:ring-1,2-phenylacetyl-CoA epoxidase subunit PaaE|nr:2Fe-2S iron-sulfur cluster-binding protein [Steroidobacteraceae bacterium]
MLKFHPLEVTQVAPDAEDAIALALEVPPELRSEYTGSAGQHVVVRAIIDGEEVRRTYSLVNAPGEWPLRIVPRVHGSGRMSRYLAEQLRTGDVLDVLPPNGSFTPRTDASPRTATYVALAAGCGITPVLAMASMLLARGARFILFYGNSGTARTMCLEELLALKDRYLERLSLHFVMSREPQEVALYNGRIDGARLRQFAATLFRPLEVAEYFVCGPGDMIEQLTATLRDLGVDPARLHAEHFTVATTGETAAPRPAAPAVAGAADTGTAEVTVLVDGRRRSFTMKMHEETVLDAAARAGVELPFSCRAGVCSTCRTKVIRGEVVMAQNYALEEWELEQGYVLACQSHVRSPTLELDYDEK